MKKNFHMHKKLYKSCYNEKRLFYLSILSHVVTNPGEWKYWLENEKVAKLMEKLPRTTPLTI